MPAGNDAVLFCCKIFVVFISESLRHYLPLQPKPNPQSGIRHLEPCFQIKALEPCPKNVTLTRPSLAVRVLSVSYQSLIINHQ